MHTPLLDHLWPNYYDRIQSGQSVTSLFYVEHSRTSLVWNSSAAPAHLSTNSYKCGMFLRSETGDTQPHGEGLPAALQNQGQWGALHYLHELPTPSLPHSNCTPMLRYCFTRSLLRFTFNFLAYKSRPYVVWIQLRGLCFKMSKHNFFVNKISLLIIYFELIFWNQST